MSKPIFTPVPAYRQSAIADGFKFECSCGELYNCWVAASSCRKCRNYCVFGYCTHVVDISTGDVVYGEVPEYEEYVRAEEAAMKRWAAEKRELDLHAQMWLKEGELYEAEMKRRAEEANKLYRELKVDRQYAIQDALMGY